MAVFDRPIALLEQMIDVMKANREKTEVNIDTSQVPREAKSKTELKETEATDVEANSVEPEAVLESEAERQDYKEPTSTDVESEAGRQKAPTEEAAVKSSGITKKRHRGRHTAAGWSAKPKKWTHGDCGSRGRFVAACRKVSAVAWCRRNIFRDIRTPGNCGSRQELGATGIMVTLRARLARRKGTFARKDPTRDSVEQGACKVRAFGERHRTKPTGSQGVKNRDVKEQLLRGSRGT
jgi:hypothetical protein